MSPDGLIKGHPYYLLGSDGNTTKVLYSGLVPVSRSACHAFKVDRYKSVSLTDRQVVEQIFSKNVSKE